MVAQTSMFIYSMESHIVYNMNNTSRRQNQTRVPTLGPIATAFTWIIMGTENFHRSNEAGALLNVMTELWRGLKLDEADI